MKNTLLSVTLACALAVLCLSLTSCGSLFADREDDVPDKDPADGVYAPNYVLKKMEEQRKTGKWRSEY